MKIPAGSKLIGSAHYDNSLKNMYNPAPEKEVYWSEQSWDEMFGPQMRITIDSQDLTKGLGPARSSNSSSKRTGSGVPLLMSASGGLRARGAWRVRRKTSITQPETGEPLASRRLLVPDTPFVQRQTIAGRDRT